LKSSYSIIAIPAFQDNYLWLIRDDNGNAVAVDPGDATPVLAYLQAHALTLTGILITHRHHDHIDGIEQLLSQWQVPVYGPNSSYIPQITEIVKHEDSVTLFNESESPITLAVMEVPGHTLDHIAYFGHINSEPALFSGDTIFAAGCGRLFDGTSQQLNRSLQRLNQLPEATQIYCSHEYTLSNLAFAHTVESDNAAINQRIERETKKRARHLPTLPTTLKLERETNPFLRYLRPTVTDSINEHWQSGWSTPDEIFAALRRWKDTF
jgi:hydroxyacylglutathione hydrolase